MKPDADTTRQLVFARFLFARGAELALLPYPTNAAALLAFHDATEVALHTAGLAIGAGVKPKTHFEEYFDLIEKKLGGQSVPLKAEMLVLNNTRNSLKHRVMPPGAIAVQMFKSRCEQFLQDFTKLIFPDIDFFSVSLVDYVAPSEAQAALREAETDREAGNYKQAAAKTAVALDAVISSHTSRRFEDLFGSRGTDSAEHYIRDGASTEFQFGWRRFMDGVEQMQEAMKLLALGIDLRGWVAFAAVTPRVHRSFGGARHVIWTQHRAPNAQDIGRCIDFVVDTALRLQEGSVE